MTKQLVSGLSLLAIGVCTTLLIGCQQDETSSRDLSPAKSAPTSNSVETTAPPKPMAYGRFVPERRDDFAWENDKVAFRVYGPAAPFEGHSSGVDAWLKRVDYAIIDKWYKAHTEGVSYHQDHGEGYDPYHTGTSRGVGGTAIWVDNTPYTAHTYKSYEVLDSGGDKVVFNLQYQWQTPLGVVSERKTISLPLGSQLFTVESVFTLDGKPTRLPVAIGVATHDEKAKVYQNQATGRISAWEVIDDYGVGTGVVSYSENVNTIQHIPSETKDESHIWILTETAEDGSLRYHAGFAWEAAGAITTVEQWNTYLDEFTTSL